MLLVNKISLEDFINYKQEHLNCLNHNLNNPYIKEIFIFIDGGHKELPKHPKIRYFTQKKTDETQLLILSQKLTLAKKIIWVKKRLIGFYEDIKLIIAEPGIYASKNFIIINRTTAIEPGLLINENFRPSKIKTTEFGELPKKEKNPLSPGPPQLFTPTPTQHTRKGGEVVATPPTFSKKLSLVIVSVNYNDFLLTTLTRNTKIFSDITVITSTEDLMSQTICQKFGVNLVISDIMYEEGAVFNKGKAINKAVESISEPGFILIVDADIIIGGGIDTADLDPTVLYTSDRWMCKTHEDLVNWESDSQNPHRYFRNDADKGLGFFQLYHYSTGFKYPEISSNASFSDLLFRDKFVVRKPVTQAVIHLGKSFTNWDGRRTERFIDDQQFHGLFSEAQNSQKRSDFTICSYYFNYNNDPRQKANFIKFLEQWKDYYDSMIVGIVDYGDIDFEIPCKKVAIAGDINKRIWSKEILINKIVSDIDTDYILCVDGDLIYENLDWLNNLEGVIGDNDFVQLFETINYLGGDGEILESHKSLVSGKNDNVDHLLDQGFKPGGAWMSRVQTLKDYPLFEEMIVGGGDTIMAYGIYGQKSGWTLSKVKEGSVKVYEKAKKWILDFGKRKCDYLSVSVDHLYHGDLKDRNYNERYKLLEKIKNRGIMLITFGFDYEKAAIYCLKSIRKYSNIPVVIHTNIPEFVRSKELNKFEQVYFETHDMNDDENRIIKTQLSKYTIFDETLYIDVDSSVISEKFLYPFEYLNEYDIVSPEWKTYTKKDIYDLSINSNKFKKFLKITEKFEFDKKTYIAGGICYFNRNDNSHRFFNDFHRFWKETGKKEDMPGLNGAMFNNELIVKIINNKEFNNYNSEIIVSHHNSLIDYEHLKDFTRKRYNPISDQWEFCNQGSTELYKKPKIAFVYDIKGWAFYIMAHNVKYHLSKKFEIDIIKFDNKIDEDNYDAIVCFSPGVLPIEIKNFEKLICGVSSHKSGKNIEKLKKFKSVFANEIRLYESIQNQDKYYIENGVDTEFFKIEKEISEKFRIGSLGSERWSEHKGKFRIEEICKRLGDGFENRSIFVDTISKIMTQKEVREYYSNIDVLVISSVSETGPNTLLEAMSCGIPVISNRIGLAPIIIDNLSDGILIDDLNNLEDYVKSIKMLKSDTVLYENISRNSKVKIKKWDWSEKSKDFEKMISKFIKL